ncbi:hypothetical protein ACFX13_034708 [Malus domestica]|uniref:disease resistance protein RPS2-like n=1 Tax=Malus sylvestris TaxID=3752 RepID=UPI0021AC8518|nr:disease resistance protein RPS2-like [Malus sylvestris]
MAFGKRGFEKLEHERKRLENEETDVKKVLAANAYRIEWLSECMDWLRKVDEERHKIENLEKRYKERERTRTINQGQSCGLLQSSWCLDLKIRMKIKRIANLRKQIKLDTIRNQSAPALPDRFIKRGALKIDDFPSLNNYVDVLFLKLLVKDGRDKCARVCIWGPSGVGKTTVLENVHDRFCELTNTDQPFDVIFWVTMTEEKGVGDIQHILEKQLGLQADELMSNYERAEIIAKELENKSYLLFIDQVSSEIDLVRIGIRKGQHGRVVLGRSGCYYDDEIGERGESWKQEDIKIEGMCQDDALKMFRKIVNSNKDVMKNEEIKRLATLIVRECGGIPQSIKTVAFNLEKESDPAVWWATLSRFANS